MMSDTTGAFPSVPDMVKIQMACINLRNINKTKILVHLTRYLGIKQVNI